MIPVPNTTIKALLRVLEQCKTELEGSTDSRRADLRRRIVLSIKDLRGRKKNII